MRCIFRKKNVCMIIVPNQIRSQRKSLLNSYSVLLKWKWQASMECHSGINSRHTNLCQYIFSVSKILKFMPTFKKPIQDIKKYTPTFGRSIKDTKNLAKTKNLANTKSSCQDKIILPRLTWPRKMMTSLEWYFSHVPWCELPELFVQCMIGSV
jgi:hypothetical protein